MSTSMLSSAHTFLLNNARLLERRIFEHRYLGAPAGPAIQALLAYWNPTGGFGNALEPDKRTASSQPIDQEFALSVLDDLGWEPEIAARVCDFLVTITTPAGGVPFVLPTVRDAPRSPWWDCTDDPPASVNPTASLAAMLHQHHTHHPWLIGADSFCWTHIEQIQDPEFHDLICLLRFLQYTPDQERAAQHLPRFRKLALERTILDPQATGYVKMPLDFAPTPESLCHSLYAHATLQAHLQALMARQQPDGGWPISWTAVSPACALEYRGVVTLAALKTLKAYGKL